MKWKFEIVSLLGLTTICLLLIALNGHLVEGKHDQDFQDSDEADDDGVVINVENEDNKSSSDETEVENYESPIAEPGRFYLAEHFDDKIAFEKQWIKSQAKKDDIAEEIAKYDGEWSIESPKKQVWKNDFGLVLKSKAKHAAIAAKLTKPFVFDEKPLIVQYEVTMQEGQECGGSYIKLLSAGKDTDNLKKFNDKTPYTIMFGPDKCGNDVKLHFIFRHVNPINGSVTEKHCRKPKERLEEPFKDKLPHLYQLALKPDNTFQIKVDHRILNEGSLLKDFNPPVNPPLEIDDPEDKKPEDWDEREKIPDPEAQKPDDWDEDAPPQIPDPSAEKPEGWLDDEPEMIPDPNAEKPADWDSDMDGEWEAPLIENPLCEKAVGCGPWKAPLISNPEYKGKWRAPLIDNPHYKGKWAPRKIPNPDYFEDLSPFKMTTISAIGFELWSMSSDILFDNLLITDDETLADEWAAKTFDLKRKHIDKESESFFGKLLKLTNENPWLWGVYIVVIGTPLSFVFYTLCCSSKEKDSVGKAKKTDEPIADDVGDEPPAEGGAKDETPVEDNNKDKSEVKNSENSSPKRRKADLEVENSLNEIKQNAKEKSPEQENLVDGDEDEPVEIENEVIIEGAEGRNNLQTITTTTTDSTRKRKPRKE